MAKEVFDFNPLLDSLLEKEKDFPSDESTSEYSQYLVLLLNTLKNRINNPMFLLTSDNIISDLKNYLRRIDDYLNTKNILNWNNIYNISRSITNTLLQIPYDNGNAIKQNFRSIINNFEKRTENLINQFSVKLNLLEQENENLNRKLEELNIRATQKEIEVSNLTDKCRDQFSDAQEQRIKEYNDLIKEKNDAFDDKLKKLDDASEGIIKLLQERNKKSLSLLGRLSSRIFGDYYSGSANKAKWFAHILFISALLYLATCSYFVYDLISKTPQVDWKVIFYKTIALFPIYIPAIYLIFEFSRQRRKEEKYQDLGMRIQTSAPYMDSIANDLKEKGETTEDFNKLRLELAKKFFTEQYRVENKSKRWISQKDMTSFVKDLLEIYTNKKD